MMNKTWFALVVDHIRTIASGILIKEEFKLGDSELIQITMSKIINKPEVIQVFH